MVETRETRTKEHIENVVHKVRRRFIHIHAAFPLALFECAEKIGDLKDIVFVSGDEVGIGEDNIHFARIGGAVLDIEEGNVDGEEKAVVKSDRFGLIGRCRKLLDRYRVNIEIFLKVENVFRTRIRHIDPRHVAKGNGFHGVAFERDLCRFTLIFAIL